MERSKLKQALLKGGLYITIRQFLSLGLSLVSILVITRRLGPTHYGWTVIALSITPFATSLADLGLKAYLIRKPGECSQRLQSEILSFLLISSTALIGLITLVSPWIANWIKIPEMALILRLIAPSILLDSCAGAPLGMLERNLQYQRSSMAEIGAQFVYSLTAIPLVLMGWDVWSVIIAYILRALFQCVVAFILCPIRPTWFKDWELLRAALHFGFGYSISQWMYQGRSFAVPLLLGKFIDVQTVGLVGATNRIADVVGFVRSVTMQLGISGFAKLQEDRSAMRRALEQGTIYQVLLLTAALGGFAVLSPVLVPLLLGHKWLGVVTLFPFLGLLSLFKGISELYKLVLYSMGKNLDVLKFHIVNLFAIGIGIVLLCPFFGVQGFIIAEVISMATYFLLYKSAARIVGGLNFRPVLWLLVFTAPAFFISPYESPLITLLMLIAGFGVAVLISKELRHASKVLLGFLGLNKASQV